MKYYKSPDPNYQRFLVKHSFLSCVEIRNHRRRIKRWKYRPCISIILPVYKVQLTHLKECLSSVEDQIYPHWELCVVEDGCGQAETRTLLRSFEEKYPEKVKLILRNQNKGITISGQQCLSMATGEFVALLDHDDRLAPEALYEVVEHLNREPETDWVYSDNDKISELGERCEYHHKPDWSPELLLTYNYILHFSVFRRSLVQEVGGFRDGFEGSQDHDLYLRISENTDRIVHIPKVLYSWRQTSDSVSLNPGSKDYAYEAALRALNAAIARRGETGRAIHAPNSWLGSYRIERKVPNTVIDIVAFGDDKRKDLCLKQYAQVKIGRFFSIKPDENAGNALSRVLKQAYSPLTLITTDNIVFPEDSILKGLLSNLVPENVVAAGAKVVDANAQVDHCGLAFAPGGKILFPLRGTAADAAGHGAHGALPRNVSILSPVMSMFKTDHLRNIIDSISVYTSQEGLVIGACFALLEQGFRIVVDGGLSVTLLAGQYKIGAELREGGSDFTMLHRRHKKFIDNGDPYYNRNLKEEPADFTL